jgi:hypothetical protein
MNCAIVGPSESQARVQQGSQAKPNMASTWTHWRTAIAEFNEAGGVGPRSTLLGKAENIGPVSNVPLLTLAE